MRILSDIYHYCLVDWHHLELLSYTKKMYKEDWKNRFAMNLDLGVGMAPAWTIHDFLHTSEEDAAQLISDAREFADILTKNLPRYWEEDNAWADRRVLHDCSAFVYHLCSFTMHAPTFFFFPLIYYFFFLKKKETSPSYVYGELRNRDHTVEWFYLFFSGRHFIYR